MIFSALWLAASFAGVILYWRFASPHYAMPLLLPLSLLFARSVDTSIAQHRWAVALLVTGAAGGQAVLAISAAHKGGAAEVARVAAAARVEHGGCIYVYDSYPALYMLTGSCLPTRWAFPGHLATNDENSASLGVDPVLEVARIMRSGPEAIVDNLPHFRGGNPLTRAVLERELASGYALVACIRTGPDRFRLVYRRRSTMRSPPTCH